MALLRENRELLEAFRRGERAAMTAVYQEYARPVFGLLREGFGFQSQGRLMRYPGLHDPLELECAVQEVFARAFAPQARQAYDGLRPFSNYLFTIARNLVIDGLRAGRHERWGRAEEDAGERREAAEAEAAGGESPERAAMEQELLAHVRGFKDALDARERAFFELRFEQGLTRDQVMARLSISAHRLNAYERGLKRRFFKLMRRHGYFEGHRWQHPPLSASTQLLLLRLGVGGVP